MFMRILVFYDRAMLNGLLVYNKDNSWIRNLHDSIVVSWTLFLFSFLLGLHEMNPLKVSQWKVLSLMGIWHYNLLWLSSNEWSMTFGVSYPLTPPHFLVFLFFLSLLWRVGGWRSLSFPCCEEMVFPVCFMAKIQRLKNRV